MRYFENGTEAGKGVNGGLRSCRLLVNILQGKTVSPSRVYTFFPSEVWEKVQLLILNQNHQ